MKGRGSITSEGLYGDENPLSNYALADIDERVARLENLSVTGVVITYPEPATPFVVAERIDSNGDVHTTVGINIPPTIQRLALQVARVKSDDSYGKIKDYDTEQFTDLELAAQYMEFEIGPLRPETEYHVLTMTARIVGQLGQGTYKVRNPITDSEISEDGNDTPLESFTTGSGQPGAQVDNEIMNSKFKYSRDAWNGDEVGGDGGGSGADDDEELAKWRLDCDRALYVTTSAHGSPSANSWNKDEGYLELRESTATDDVCARLYRFPFDPGETIWIQFLARRTAGFTGVGMEVSLHEVDPPVGGSNQIGDEQLISSSILNALSSSDWSWVRTRIDVPTDYEPDYTKAQWIRFHLTTDAPASNHLKMDKVSASLQAGAYKPNARDREQPVNNPDGRTQVTDATRGTNSFGTSGNEVPVGTARIMRNYTD